MKINVTIEPPPILPDRKVTIEMGHGDAKILRKLLGSFATSEVQQITGVTRERALEFEKLYYVLGVVE